MVFKHACLQHPLAYPLLHPAMKKTRKRVVTNLRVAMDTPIFEPSGPEVAPAASRGPSRRLKVGAAQAPPTGPTGFGGTFGMVCLQCTMHYMIGSQGKT